MIRRLLATAALAAFAALALGAPAHAGDHFASGVVTQDANIWA
ncbi:hypothetical protein ACFVWN_25740 [Nocardiopsis flavescens]